MFGIRELCFITLLTVTVAAAEQANNGAADAKTSQDSQPEYKPVEIPLTEVLDQYRKQFGDQSKTPQFVNAWMPQEIPPANNHQQAAPNQVQNPVETKLGLQNLPPPPGQDWPPPVQNNFQPNIQGWIPEGVQQWPDQQAQEQQQQQQQQQQQPVVQWPAMGQWQEQSQGGFFPPPENSGGVDFNPIGSYYPSQPYYPNYDNSGPPCEYEDEAAAAEGEEDRPCGGGGDYDYGQGSGGVPVCNLDTCVRRCQEHFGFTEGACYNDECYCKKDTSQSNKEVEWHTSIP